VIEIQDNNKCDEDSQVDDQTIKEFYFHELQSQVKERLSLLDINTHLQPAVDSS